MGIFSWREKQAEPGADDGAEMSFLDHLEELRWHLVRSTVVIFILGCVLFFFRQEVMREVFIRPMTPDFASYHWLSYLSDAFSYDQIAEDMKNISMQALTPYEQFMKAMVYAMFGGLIIAFPYVVWEIWRFIKPGLKDKEVKAVRWNVVTISLLFFTGVAFGYYVILPFSMKFFANFTLFEGSLSDVAGEVKHGVEEGIQNNWRIGDMISFIMMLMLGTGILFQLPVVVYYLTKMGLVYPDWLRTYRKHAIIAILILAAFLTPPDPLSQIVIAIPLYFLYQISILISQRVYNQMQKEEAEASAAEAARAAAIDKLEANTNPDE